MNIISRSCKFNPEEDVIPQYASVFQFDNDIAGDMNWHYIYSPADILPRYRLFVMIDSLRSESLNAPSLNIEKVITIISHNQLPPLWSRCWRYASDMEIGTLYYTESIFRDKPESDFMVSKEETMKFDTMIIRVNARTVWFVNMNQKLQEN